MDVAKWKAVTISTSSKVGFSFKSAGSYLLMTQWFILVWTTSNCGAAAGLMHISKWWGISHIIKKDRLSTRFFAAIFRVVAACRLVMCLRTVWYRYLHRPLYAKWRSRDLWSMEQEWFKSQRGQECNKCIIISFKRIGFRQGKMLPSSGWLPPCSLLVKKWAKAPKFGGE